MDFTIPQNIKELLDIYTRLTRDFAGHAQSVRRPISLPRPALWWGWVWKLLNTGTSFAQFREHLTLVRCDVSVSQERAICFDLRWHAREVSPEWVVFIHFVDENGATQLQGDHRMIPYDQDPWGFITYRLSIGTAECHRGKKYRVRLGVWSPESNARLPVKRSRGWDMETAESAVRLGVVQIR